MAWSSTGTQSGTDTSLSGITSVTGVLVNVSANGHKTYQVPTSISLLTITGTLSWDSDYETLECSESTRMEVNAGASVEIGKATTINSKVRYSKGTGLIMNKQQGSPFINTSACNIWVKASTSLVLGGKFIVNGSRIMSGGGIFCGNSTTPTNNFVTFTLNGGAVLQNITGQTMQMVRCFCEPSGININQGTIDGRTFGGIPFSNAGWGTLAMSLEFGNFQCDGNGAVAPVTVPNASLANNVNVNDYSYVANSNDKTRINKYIFQNSDVGSGLRTLGQTGTTWRLGVVEITKDVVFNIANTVGTGLENAVVYTKMLGATLNPSSGSRYDGIDNYTTPRVYIKSTASTGLTTTTNILYAVAQGYATDATNAGTALTTDSLTTKTSDVHDGNYIWSYGHLLGQASTAMRGTGTLTQGWTLFDDVNVTLDRTSANALIGTKFSFNTSTKKITVIANASYDELYDANKAFKCSTTQANIEAPIINELIVTASGTYLEAYTDWTLEVATGVTLAQGTKFTKVKFDTITLTGTGAITGVYENSVGTSTIWEFGATAEPIIAGTSLAIYDASGTTKYYNAVTSDGVYRYYIAPQSTGATYTYAIERYGYKREEGTFPSNAGGISGYAPSYGEDVGITETNRATVAAYTTLSDTAQIYDATANFRLSETGIKLGQLVARDGTYLDFGNFNVKIKDDASAIVAVSSGTITYKSIVINESTKYNAMKATPPKTITPTDTEIINVLIEDANGDSQVSILGGDNESYEIWKIPTTTATDDYATGTLLATLPDNTTPFRFIGISGFDLVGRDTSSGVRRRSSMLKGSYEQAFYVGNQIQLATDAPQLLENNLKLDELILKVDTNLDEKISTRLAEIDYVAPHNAEIDAIKAVTDTLENYDDATTQTKLDAIKTKTDTLVNTDLTGIATTQNVTDAKDEILTEIGNIPATDLTGVEADLVKINLNVKDASLFIPATRDL